MALACLACHAMDNSTDSFRMDGSFRMQNMSIRSTLSDDGTGGCGRVSSCFTKQNSKPAAASGSSTNNRRHNGGVGRGEKGGVLPSRKATGPSIESLEGGGEDAGGGGGSMATFGRQQPEVSLEHIGFPEPRLTRCHAVRRDIFRNFSVGDSDTEFQGRRFCFNLSGATA